MCNAFNHSPGCTCGWGGEGHLGRSYGPHHFGSDIHSSWLNYPRTREESFCRPTRCHYCKDPVFLVKHNGGFAWFNHLGKPWPKHGCYYAGQLMSSQIKSTTRTLNEWDFGLINPCAGVVVDTETTTKNEKFIIIKRHDDMEIFVRVHATFAVEWFFGEFVVFSMNEGKLLRPFLSLVTEFKIEEIQFLPQSLELPPNTIKNTDRARPNPSTQRHSFTFCKICRVRVRLDRIHKHMRKQHP